MDGRKFTGQGRSPVNSTGKDGTSVSSNIKTKRQNNDDSLMQSSSRNRASMENKPMQRVTVNALVKTLDTVSADSLDSIMTDLSNHALLPITFNFHPQYELQVGDRRENDKCSHSLHCRKTYAAFLSCK